MFLPDTKGANERIPGSDDSQNGGTEVLLGPAEVVPEGVEGQTGSVRVENGAAIGLLVTDEGQKCVAE
jgi:hypothetical protein